MTKFCKGDTGICSVCGFPYIKGSYQNCPAPNAVWSAIPESHNIKRGIKQERILLGDKLESGLKSLGITEHTYRNFKVFVGLSDNCNCKGRKEGLNKLHANVREGIKHLKEGDLKSLAELAGVSFNAVKRKLFGGSLPPQEDH